MSSRTNHKVHSLLADSIVRVFFMPEYDWLNSPQLEIEKLQTIDKDSVYKMKETIRVMFMEDFVIVENYNERTIYQGIKISKIKSIKGAFRSFKSSCVILLDKMIKLIEETEGKSHSAFPYRQEEYVLVFINYENLSYIILAHDGWFIE